MRCTDCNRELKPVVAIDIDGTLGDYHRHFLTFAAEWLGESHLNWMHYNGSVDLATHMSISKEVYRTIKLAYRQGGMKRTMPVLRQEEKPAKILGDLREVAEVWITTTRPYNRLDNVDPDTVEWLRRNGFTYDGLLYNDNKVTALIDIVGLNRIVGVVDDQADIYDTAEILELNPILMRSWFNRAVQRPVIAGSMAQASAYLRANIQEWSQQNGST